eukprot:TRINITY_DN4351_c0_g1_i1.p1 TRINITY_DN4351_c0_g1~~TRINITY_DN4351_c0_g1_i1.p1  ORF type:complete len:492 (+),score=115.12 TRINITY_DN4351_c0_g1_i1:69-1544(+)
MIALPMLAVIAGILVVLWYFVFFKRYYNPKVDPRIPSFKHMRGFVAMAMHFDRINHYSTMVRCARDKGSIFGYSMIGRTWVAISDPSMIEEVLTSPHTVDKPTIGYDNLKNLLGKQSLVTINGEEWRVQRRLLSKAFQSNHMQTFVGMFGEASLVLLDCLLGASNRKAFNLSDYTMRFAVDVVTRAMFSKAFDLQRNHNSEIPTALIACVDELAKRGAASPLRKFHPVHRMAFKRNHAKVGKAILDVIAEHQQALASGTKDGPYDMIDLMLTATDDQSDARLTTEDVYSQCLTFFFAGHDTTAHTLAWIMYHIASSVDVEQKVLAEVDAVLGERLTPSFADLGQLKYVTNVIKETLRLHPPVPLVLRECKGDMTIAGYAIPKGTVVSILSHATHLNEEHWPDALVFNPDRFTEENSAARHPYAWMPFLQRERNCIGMNFAMQELKVAIATVYRQAVLRHDVLKYPVVRSLLTMQTDRDGIAMFAQKRVGAI